jgi:hypothetical protein
MGLKILYKFAILTNSNDSLLPNLILNLTKGRVRRTVLVRLQF